MNQVPQIVKPTIRVVSRPLVQFGLDLQYPLPGRFGIWPRRVGIHQRPSDFPIPELRTRCPPSPCGQLSWPPTTTRTPPHPRAIGRRRACPSPISLIGGKGNPEVVPTFTVDRSTDEAPSFSPAASPRVRRRPSPWPPCRPYSSTRESSGPPLGRALRPGPYPPDWSRFWT
jgi:hypothetical protein